MRDRRIVSFLPAATEMVYLLGLEDRLVGVTHECDYPPPAKAKPVLVDCALELQGLTPKEVDDAVSARIRSGRSLYKVDEEKLRQAAPELLITQDLCQVCGPSGNEVSQVLKTLTPPPEVLWQTPRDMDGIFEVLLELGRATGREDAARNWVADARNRIQAVALKTQGLKRVRVAFLEWVEPVYSAGHWVPEMIDWAGGHDYNGSKGGDSVRVSWDAVIGQKPEVVIVSPCGFKTAKALEQARLLPRIPGARVYAVDADSYFARPGPRVVDGVELLAHLLHPEAFGWSGPSDALAPVPVRP